MSKHAVVFLADGFEEIEAVTAIDVLRRAAIEVTIVGLNAKAVKGSRGITVLADVISSELKDNFDAYILPGGMPGATNLANRELVRTTLLGAFKSGKLIAAICASPALVLAPLGILKGKSATCFPGMEKDFGRDIQFKPDMVVADGNVITSRGPATAMAFALAIVHALVGHESSEKIRKALLMS